MIDMLTEKYIFARDFQIYCLSVRRKALNSYDGSDIIMHQFFCSHVSKCKTRVSAKFF